jgi:MEDS: MEthanogen/methylotroph, DcmR Sensory domain
MNDPNPPVHLAGSTMGADNHMCAFFQTRDDEYESLLPFISEGFEQGDRAFHIVDPALRADHVHRLGRAGLPTADAEQRQQLEIRDWDGVYLLGGQFSQDAMLALVKEVLGGPVGGYSRTRVVAHMEWALGDFPGVNDLVEYETRLNYLLPRWQHPVICVYDSSRFGAGLALDVLRTHPSVILGGVLQVNPFYVPPDEFLRQLRQRSERVAAG